MFISPHFIVVATLPGLWESKCVCEIFVNFRIHATCKDWWTLGILVFELMSLERRIHKCGNSGRAFKYKGSWYFHCEGNVAAYNLEDTIIVTKHFSRIRSCNDPEAVGVRRHPFAGWIEFQIATNSFENSLKQAIWGHLHPVMKWVMGVPNRGVAILHSRVPIQCRSMPRSPREFLRPGLWGEPGERGRILVNLRAGRWVIMDYWIVWPYLHCSFGPSPKASETSK